MKKPTTEKYDELQRLYEFFNNELFHKILPNCLITLQRRSGVMGYFAKELWANSSGEIADEIAINPSYVNKANIDEMMQTLVHEMAHLWQKHFGKPGRGRYHNKEWALKMESIGLMPSSTGKPGGKKTGDHMNDYIIKGGLLDQVLNRLKKSGFSISWTDRLFERLADSYTNGNSGSRNGSNRERYACPGCHIKAWGRPGLNLICGECEQRLI